MQNRKGKIPDTGKILEIVKVVNSLRFEEVVGQW